MPQKRNSVPVIKSFGQKVVATLKAGGIGVIPTDTIYGLVGSALDKKIVERIYKIRRRNPKKPMIILIGEFSDLKKFKINLSYTAKKIVSKYWPDKVSIILPCDRSQFKYLHRGTKMLALRLPKFKTLRILLKKTGPLVAPSANIEGWPPAKTIKEAQKYFGNKIDFYVDTGRLSSKPSKLFKIEKRKIVKLRG